MLSYFVGHGWMAVFLGLALLSVVGAFLLNRTGGRGYEPRRLPLTMPAMGLIGVAFVMVALALWAGTHFRVSVNHRAILKDTIKQQWVGIRESGVQSRPLIGIQATEWPATRAEQFKFTLEQGLASAPAKGTNTALKLAPTFSLDLRGLDIESAVRDGYTTYEDFRDRYIFAQVANIYRGVTQRYTVAEHNTKKEEWSREFEKAFRTYLSQPGKGYGMEVVEGRTTMEWDFANPDDGKEYDRTNRSYFLLVEKQNLLDAAEKDAEIASARAAVLNQTALQSVTSWGTVMGYVRSLSAEERAALFEYWRLQPQMEYLRVISDLKPAQPLPPGNAPAFTFSTNQ